MVVIYSCDNHPDNVHNDGEEDEESVGAILRGTMTAPPPCTPKKTKAFNSMETSPSGETDLESDSASPKSTVEDCKTQPGPPPPQPQRLTMNEDKGHEDDKQQLYRRRMGPSMETTTRLCRPVVLGLGFLLFIAFGGVGFLLDQFLRLPGFKRQIELLEEQVQELETQVTRLETAVDDLNAENDRFSSLNNELNGTVAELSYINHHFQMLNQQLNESNMELERLTVILANQTAEYSAHNEELRSLVGFLNNTSAELGQSIEQLTAFLDDGVQFFQSSSLRALELDYRVLIRSWDCDFRDFFSGDNFTVDATVAVGETRYPQVRSYVQDRVLDDLCLNSTDWEIFMEETIIQGPMEDVTTNLLVRGVQNYTTLALQFYFPNDAKDEVEVEPSLAWSDWSEAEYQCANLKQTFSWVLSQL